MTATAAEVLTQLIALHRLDQRIRRHTASLESAPASAGERQRKVDEIDRKIADIQGKVKILRTQIRIHENEVRAQEGKIERLKGQASEVRSNKEFMAFKSEISNAKAESDRVQNQVIKILDVVEQAETKVKAQQVKRARLQEEAEAAKQALQERLIKVKEERDALMTQRASVVGEIPKEALGLYERARSARGAGMATLESAYCGGCGAMATRNDVYAVQNRSRITPCKACNRILYMP